MMNKSKNIMPYVFENASTFKRTLGASFTPRHPFRRTITTLFINLQQKTAKDMNNREGAPGPESPLEASSQRDTSWSGEPSLPADIRIIDFATLNTTNGRRTPQLSINTFIIPNSDYPADESPFDQDMTRQDIFLLEDVSALANEDPFIIGLDEADTRAQAIHYPPDGSGISEDLFSFLDESGNYLGSPVNFAHQRTGASSTVGTIGSSVLDAESESTGSIQRQTSSVGSSSRAPAEAVEIAETRPIKNCFKAREDMIGQMTADIYQYDACKERKFGLGALDLKSSENQWRLPKRPRAEENEVTFREERPWMRRNAIGRGTRSRFRERSSSR
jgi:hypothetical protein